MPDPNALVAVFDTAGDTEAALAALFRYGFDRHRVSIAVRESRVAQLALAYSQNGSGLRYWGGLERLWKAVSDLLPEWALIVVPGAGPVLAAGPLARWVSAGLDNAALFEGLDPLAVGLYSIGISREKIAHYEAALRDGCYLVVIHGPSGYVERARAVLDSTRRRPRGVNHSTGA